MTPQSVTAHGITPSDTRPCGIALNALLKDQPGSWHFPAGTYLIEQTIRLPSGTRLTLDPAATLRLADGAARTENDYLITNADPTAGDRDISIEGGTFDGNQTGNPRPEGLFAAGYTGAMIHFENVRGLTLKNLTMTNAEAYYSRYTHVHEFHIEGITFDSQRVRHNNDGIHVGGNCSHGVIRKIRATTPGVTGDDLVALNADDALTRNEVRGMTNGPIEDLVVEDLEAHSCHSFVRLLSVFSPIRNVTIRKVRGGCLVGALNADGARGCRVPVFDEANPPHPDGVGLLENIHASDFFVHKAGPNGMALVDLQERLRNVTVTEFRRDLDRDQSSETPTLRLRHQEIENGVLNGTPLTPQNTQPPHPAYESSPATIELALNVSR